jgi:hypothetical protein
MTDKLERLAALSRGAAIVTLGVGAASAACTRSDPTPPPTVAPAAADQAATTADASDAGATDPDGGRWHRRFPIPNAIHRWPAPDGGLGTGPRPASSTESQ